MAANQFAKNFIRDRSLAESTEARELIPVMTAIDALLLQDQQLGVINTTGLERLAKKAYGIVAAFKSVEKKDDWKKPVNAAKHWRSKVNEELWRRIDPARAEADDRQFSNRKLEEDIRTEVDRYAQLLKAFAKLEERAKGD